MKFYWYDYLSVTRASDAPVREGLSDLVKHFSAEKLGSPTQFSRASGSRLAFVHASSEVPGADQDDWIKCAAKEARVILVSSVGLGQSRAEFVHALRKPCVEVAKCITLDIASAFIASCQSGNPNFELLYPCPTENLVALYLLVLARKETGNHQLGSEIYGQVLAAAQEEYSSIVSRTGNQAKRVLSNDAETCISELRNVLAGAK
jgi:hypothetical protein